MEPNLLEYRRALRYFHRTNRLDYFELTPEQRKIAAGKHPERLLDPEWCNAHLHQRTPTQTPNPPYPQAHTDPIGTELKRDYTNPSWSDEGDDAERKRPYWMNQLVTMEREEREALHITSKDYGKSWKCKFWKMIGDKPECGPGDHSAAENFWYRIRQALDHGGWTPSEQNRLRSMEKKWRDRKDGKDPRFEVVGTLHGGPNERERREIHDRRVLAGMMDIIKQYRGY